MPEFDSPPEGALDETPEIPDEATPQSAPSQAQSADDRGALGGYARPDGKSAPPIYSPKQTLPPEQGWHTEYCGPACDADGMCGDPYCGPNVYWGRAEFLLWWTKGMELPPLASTDVLPGGTVLFGDETVGDERRPGGRATLGIWMDDCHSWAVGVKFFALGSQTSRFDSRDTGAATVGRPFQELVAPQLAQEQILIVNGVSPQLGPVTGRVEAETDADLLGGEVFLRAQLHCNDVRRLDLLIGYQGTQIEEELRVRHFSDQVNGNASFSALDQFRTVSEFHGGEIGFMLEYSVNSWVLEAVAKAGIGNMHQQVSIFGEGNVNGGVFPGGLLALQSNIGTFGKNEFSIVPEFDLTLGYRATDRIFITFGYTWIHWNNVVQAGDQIDRVVNPALLPGPGQILGADPQRPRFRFHETDYWAHGLSFGVQVMY